MLCNNSELLLPHMKRAKDVDEYIANAPEEVQGKLRELREIIKSSVPDAIEKISYGMPYYGYKGRLAYFAYFKDHLSLFVMHGVLDDYKNEVKDLRTGAATLRFALDQRLPVPLITKLIKATVKKNEEAKQ